MRYFISDTHFDHNRIIQYCNRPYCSADEMNKEIIKIWNKHIKESDTVYFLGDFGISKKRVFDKDLIKSLNGQKHLILGNHDIGYKQKPKYLQTSRYIESGWLSVQHQLEIVLRNNINTLLIHNPKDIEYDEIIIHGHLHGRYLKDHNKLDVSFDTLLKPISEDFLIKTIRDNRQFIKSNLTDFYNKV